MEEKTYFYSVRGGNGLCVDGVVQGDERPEEVLRLVRESCKEQLACSDVNVVAFNRI